MVSKKHAPRASTKISGAASLSLSDAARPQHSTALKSALAPSGLQLSRFASVIEGHDSQQTKVDETHAVVARDTDMTADAVEITHPDPITISSAEEDSDSDDLDKMEDGGSILPNGTGKTDKMEKNRTYPGSDEEKQEADEPSFGDLIRANGAKVVDVADFATAHNGQDVVSYERPGGKGSSGMSLGTVLAQALRTNDTSLLESCLHEQGLNIVRATIERLDSALAMSLLQRLAEKLHTRPGRSGALMVWIQWTLISHGGYLSSQPDLTTKLATLQQVVKARADSLQPLLSLKGKLDMLEAQMNLRRSMQKRSAMTIAAADNIEDAALYVEGRPSSNSNASSEDQGSNDNESSGADSDTKSDEQDASDVGMDDEDSDESQSNVINGFIDDEAMESDESADRDSGNEAVDYDDVESMDEASDEEQPKRKRISRSALTNGIR